MGGRERMVPLWRGTIGRRGYASASLALIALRHGLHHLARGTAQGTSAYAGFWSPRSVVGDLPSGDRAVFVAMAALAVTIGIAGLALTLRRLRDAALPAWCVVLLFWPVVNVALFVVLVLAPAGAGRTASGAAGSRGAGSVSAGRSAALGALLSRSRAAAGAAGVVLSAPLVGAWLLAGEEWGWILLGLPLCLGLLSALAHGHAEPCALPRLLDAGLLSIVFATLSVGAVTGASPFWVLVLLPVVLPLTALGVLLGDAVHRLRHRGPPRAIRMRGGDSGDTEVMHVDATARAG